LGGRGPGGGVRESHGWGAGLGRKRKRAAVARFRAAEGRGGLCWVTGPPAMVNLEVGSGGGEET
jgi:hypothetical protein